MTIKFNVNNGSQQHAVFIQQHTKRYKSEIRNKEQTCATFAAADVGRGRLLGRGDALWVVGGGLVWGTVGGCVESMLSYWQKRILMLSYVTGI